MLNDSDEWILNLEGFQIWLNEFRQKGNITDKDYMIQVLNNLPNKYNVILNRFENYLTVTGDNELTINVIHKNWIPSAKN